MVAKRIDQLVRERVDNRCEYCRLPQAAVRFRFPLDHVTARQHQSDEPRSGERPIDSPLNPRLDQWADHFRWEGVIAVGVTDVGRTTVRLLRMNDPVRVALREHLVAEGSVL